MLIKLQAKSAIGALAVGLSFSLVVVSKAEAVTFNFTKIVDTNTLIPNSNDNFNLFSSFNGPALPALKDGKLAFRDSDENASKQSIFTYIDGSFQLVADTNTTIPESTSKFSYFNQPLIDNNGNVAFVGISPPYCPFPRGCNYPEGIYTNVSGSLKVIAAEPPTQTAPPIGNFIGLGDISFEDGNVAFVGITSYESTGDSGIYINSNSGESQQTLVDGNTSIPGGVGKFSYFYNPWLANGNIAFVGNGNSDTPESGVYTNANGSLQVVADLKTPIPGGTGNFEGFSESLLDRNGNVAFKGYGGSLSERGIYINVDGSLKLVADLNTARPGGDGNFVELGNFSLDNGNIAFLGSGFEARGAYGYETGIYTDIGGSLTKLIARNDFFDGKNVEVLALGKQALDDSQIAFLAAFTDGSRGIYIATANTTPTSVPESSFGYGMLAFGALGTGWILTKKNRKQAS